MPRFRVRLKKTLNRRVAGVAYYKWLLADVPKDLVDELGWDEKTELEGSIVNGALRVKRKD